MKFYLATRWPNREKMRAIRDKIISTGHEVTSTWLDTDVGNKRKQALVDLADIDKADVVVLWPDLHANTPPRYGGCFFEAGYAYGRFIEVWMIDETSPCIFTKHLSTMEFDDWEEFFEFITSEGKEPGCKTESAYPKWMLDQGASAVLGEPVLTVNPAGGIFGNAADQEVADQMVVEAFTDASQKWSPMPGMLTNITVPEYPPQTNFSLNGVPQEEWSKSSLQIDPASKPISTAPENVTF